MMLDIKQVVEQGHAYLFVNEYLINIKLLILLASIKKMSKSRHPQLQLTRPDPYLFTIQCTRPKTKYPLQFPQPQLQSLPFIKPEYSRPQVVSEIVGKHEIQTSTAEAEQVVGDTKINAVVTDTNQKKNQILLLRARINSLRQHRVHNEKKLNRSLETVSKINSTREKAVERQKFQALLADRRQQESSMRKTRTNTFRLQIKKELEKARSKIVEENQEKAREQRKIRKEEQQYILKSRELERQENQAKASLVKQFQKQHNKKMNVFYETSRARSHYNHLARFNRHVNERSKIEEILKDLQKEEETLRHQAQVSDILLREAEDKLRSAVIESRVKSMSRSGCRSQRSCY